MDQDPEHAHPAVNNCTIMPPGPCKRFTHSRRKHRGKFLILAVAEAWARIPVMGIAEMIRDGAETPDEHSLSLAAQMDEETDRAVDQHLDCLVSQGHFADLAAVAQRDEKDCKTFPPHEFRNERGTS